MTLYKNFITVTIALLIGLLVTACISETKDTTPPVITLNGKPTMTLEQNVVYAELGATALDAVDGNVTVSISGTVDTSTVGNYVLTYTATDSAGNEAKRTREVKVANTIPTFTSLKLESNASTLNVGESARLTLTGTYSDNTSKTVDAHVTYSVNPAENVEVNGSVITAKKDGNVTVQAVADGVKSSILTFDITWIVNGHRLPPEPDPKVNNSTLLGVDVNHNDVRDDVERWIYKTYKDKHPIHIDIAMQAGRAYKKVLETPERAKEIYSEVDKAAYCELYYRLNAKYFNEPLLVKENIDTEYFRRKIYFNTKERWDAYIQYDTLLSGDTYIFPKIKERKALCDFNTSKYEE